MERGETLIPVANPWPTSDLAREHVERVLKMGWISGFTPVVEEFEKAFAEYVGARNAVACSSGTAAIELALTALELHEGEIIMPSFTAIACPMAAMRVGLKPVFVDVDPQMWTMDRNAVKEKVNANTAAVLPVHLWGHPVDMTPVFKASGPIQTVEDCAWGIGAKVDGRHVGTFGRVSCFSLYANKLVTSGEGGMVVTNDDYVAEKARRMRAWSFGKGWDRFVHEERCYNYRMTALQAAYGLGSLARVEETIEAKRKINTLYKIQLSDVEGIMFRTDSPKVESVPAVVGIVLNPKLSINTREFAGRLLERGVDTRPFFTGMHAQPILKRLGVVKDHEPLPVTQLLSEFGLYIPSGPNINADEIMYVSETIKSEIANVLRRQ